MLLLFAPVSYEQYQNIGVFIDLQFNSLFGKFDLTIKIFLSWFLPIVKRKVVFELLIISSINQTLQGLSSQIGIFDFSLEPISIRGFFESLEWSIQKLQPSFFQAWSCRQNLYLGNIYLKSTVQPFGALGIIGSSKQILHSHSK